MNVILTTRCNKNCSFCFARRARQEAKLEDMSLENFCKILSLLKKEKPVSAIKILGGEPTLHPDFPEIIKHLIKDKIRHTLISNLLYEEGVRSNIDKAIETGVMIGVLANAAELNSGSTMTIFKKNYKNILEKTKGTFITAGITLSREKSLMDEVQYIDFLAENIDIQKLRISLDFQEENKKDEFFINNKKQGEKIRVIIHKCLDLRIPMSWDCKIYPCMFEDNIFTKEIKGFISHLYTGCSIASAPFDVFPDMSYAHCYPARRLAGQNILKFSQISEAKAEIAFLKNVLYSMGKTNLPKICYSCEYYKSGECDSLCLGCRELTASFV